MTKTIPDHREHRTWLVDMDNTLCRGKSYTPEECLQAEPIQEVIDKVNSLSRVDNIIIYTARQDELIPATLKWLRRYDVHFHAISNNKIPALGFYIDDMAMLIDDFLET